jgi:ATP-dependent DNA helicase RecG
VEQALTTAGRLDDPLPTHLRQELGMPGLVEAVTAVHTPPPPPAKGQTGRVLIRLERRQSPAHRRLAFDELLAFCCGVAEYRARRLALGAPPVKRRPSFDALKRQVLPFELTGAQQRVVDEIVHDLEQDHPMARLVQGDVGSGKTVVALLALLVTLDSGHQGALMAPTELLAEQHHRTLASMLEGSPYRPELLSSSLPAAEHRRVRQGLANGSVRLVVGTHALIQEAVAFHRLGLAVVDEQHRFGVAQRQALLDKGQAPHLLVMTATPIPRTLALTVYGDLEVSVIDEMPPGRRPVRTVLRTAAAKPRLYAFLRSELEQGGRVFVVCPLIEASDAVQAKALDEHVREVRRELAEDRVGVLHGRMRATERDEAYAHFRDGSVPVLLATTVVEVGVDVPEASVMVIESPERFGLAQLHQLRGRVGRGERESWCVLLAEEDMARTTRRRLETLCRSSDGFVIAEADLRLRGPGEVTGTRQWGPNQFRLADLIGHRALVPRAQAVARQLAESGELATVRAALAQYHRVDVDLPAG